MAVFNINGDQIGIDSVDESTLHFLNQGGTMKLVSHRGFSAVAPENTLPAYKAAKRAGLKYVETDVMYTSDGAFVLLHDTGIGRTSNGTGTIFNMTLEQVRQYDFGSWKDPEYTGTKIPTLQEFLALCRDYSLHPYIELKTSFTQEQMVQIVDLVDDHSLRGKCTYISFYSADLTYIKNYDDQARLGYLSSGSNYSGYIGTCQSLMTGNNEVFLDAAATALTDEFCNACKSAGLPLEAWTIDDDATVIQLNDYVSGVTSNDILGMRSICKNGKLFTFK